MQVDVYDGSVLVLPGWENHLEGTEAERLREKKQQCKDHGAFNVAGSHQGSSLDVK